MISWRGRWTAFGRVGGGLACVAMIVVGCQSLTRGTAAVDRSDVPVYRASVSSSVAESSSSSASRESSRQSSVSAAAVRSACEELADTSGTAVDALNEFVHAFNDDTLDADAKAKPATDALNASADRVAASESPPLRDDLKQALDAWVAAARDMAAIASRTFAMAEFNAAVKRLNGVKTTALRLCQAAS